MRRFNWIVILLSVALLGASAVSAHEGGWRVATIESIPELIGEDYGARNVILSPDGTRLAWGEGQDLCIYTIDTASTECDTTPETYNGFGGNYATLIWSPDSRSLAFTESTFDYFVDGDIWVYDVESRTFEDRTDDDYFGGMVSFEDKDKDRVFIIDYLPTWNPANGDLYFFRSVRSPGGDTTITLQLMPLGRTEPKQVADFTDDFPMFSVFRPASISPDGTRIAVIIMAQKLDDPQNGIYVVNLKDGSIDHVITVDQFTLGMPDWAAEAARFLYPDAAPRWVGTDALVVTLLDGSYGLNLAQSALYVDLVSGEVSPMVDYSRITDRTALFADLDQFSSPVYLIPRAGVVSPDGDTFIFLSGSPESDKAAISTVTLPPDITSAPSQIGHIDDFAISLPAFALPTISADGTRALLFGYLITFESPE